MFWLAFIGVYLFTLGIAGVFVEYHSQIKRKAAGVLYYSIRRLQKIFIRIINPLGEVVNERMIRE
jgi:hypothetical protein